MFWHAVAFSDVVFLHACKMGLEGVVSKRLTERHWLDWFVDASGRHAANVARPVAAALVVLERRWVYPGAGPAA
jgi:hypothetical protein